MGDYRQTRNCAGHEFCAIAQKIRPPRRGCCHFRALLRTNDQPRPTSRAETR